MLPCFRSEIEVDGVVVSMVHCFQSGTVTLQLEDGQIRKLLWGQSQTLFSATELYVLLSGVLFEFY